MSKPMERMDLDGVAAARRLAALSPQTQRRFDQCMSPSLIGPEQVWKAFRAIGVAIGSKREPVSDPDKKKLFAFIEQLLNYGSFEVSNAVATCLLEQIWKAARTGGLDFNDVDPYLGAEARRYLVAWDSFNNTKTEGLRPK